MAANVTLAGSQGTNFAADAITAVATLNARGGEIWNGGSDDIWIAEGQSTITTDGSDLNSIRLLPTVPNFVINPDTLQRVMRAPGQKYDLNPTTAFFAFRANNSTAQITYIPPRNKL